MSEHNTLSDREQAEGWALLFDGKTTAGWRGYQKDHVPDEWQVRDGELMLTAKGGGDIITTDTFGDFDLSIEYRISEGGNSGIFYRGAEDEQTIWRTAFEVQVLDDERHPDAKNGDDRKAGALYALYPPMVPAKAALEWNHVRVIARGTEVEHHLNGQLVVRFDTASDEYRQRVAASKFVKFPTFGTFASGHIGLQDHGDVVWYRNIKVRRL